MAKYMLLIVGDNEPQDLSPAQMQSIYEEYSAWAGGMAAQGKLVSANQLSDAHKIVKGHGAEVAVTDGPYAETKEIIGGYFLIEAASEDEAVSIATGCPGLKRGGKVAVHQVIER